MEYGWGDEMGWMNGIMVGVIFGFFRLDLVYVRGRMEGLWSVCGGGCMRCMYDVLG